MSMTEALVLIDTPKYITTDELKNLGYRFSGDQIPLGEKPYRYGILKVWNVEDKKEVGFSYLFSTRQRKGVILPQPYAFYELHKVKNVDSFIAEQGID